MESYILAFDLGTSGNKAVLFDESGGATASVVEAYGTRYPRPGWAEQDAESWWSSAAKACRALLERSGAPPERIAAIGISGHMMGCLPVDAAGRPLAPSMIHADARAAGESAELADRFGAEAFYRVTGNRMAPQYPLPKIAWLGKNEPEILRDAAWFLQSKDYLAFRLTGRLGYTDFSDASLTGLFDLRSRRWSPELAELAGVSVERFPEAVSSATVIGEVTAEAARATGLRRGTPVVIGGGDGACATIGAGALNPGEAYNYGGSTSWVSMVTTEPVFDPAMRVFSLLDLRPDRANVLGTMQCAGASFEWFADRLGVPESAGDERAGRDRFEVIGRAAAEIPAGSERLIFLPYLMGERSPIWDAAARGALLGLTLRHGRAHMARAVLEGIAYALGSIVEALEEAAGPISSLSVIGGLARGDLFLKILASVLEQELRLPGDPMQATSRGAAIAAAVGVGLLPSYEAARRWIAVERVVAPDPELVDRYRAYAALYRDVYPALRDIFARLEGLP